MKITVKDINDKLGRYYYIFAFVVGLAALLIAYLTLKATPPVPNVQPECSFPECNNVKGSKIHVLESFTLSNGYDTRKNIKKVYIDTVSLTKTASEVELAKTGNDLRKKAFQEAIEWVRRVHNFNAAGFIDESYGQTVDYTGLINDLKNKKTALTNALNILKIDEYYNCNTCTYHLEITFFTPADADDLIPIDVRNVLKNYIQQAPSYKGLESTNFSMPAQSEVNLMDLLSFLLNNRGFSKEMKDKLDTYKVYMKYMDAETNNFFGEMSDNTVKIENFTSGEYKLSSVMTIIIRELLKALQGQVVKYPLKKWSIEIIGYADQSAVKSGISYDDTGRWSATGLGIHFATKDEGEPIGSTIQTNLELSYARAFAGLSFLHNNLPGDMAKDMNLLYKGAGVDNSARDKWQKRRIEIHVSNQ